MKNKINKKILFLVLIIIFILIITMVCLFIRKKDENVINTYSVNEYGLMRDENTITDETFDEYGNLTHYKYKHKLEDGSIFEKEYNIKYTFDAKNRITKVKYDDNYINIKYNKENKISNLINLIKEDDLVQRYEFKFKYDDTITNINSEKSYTYIDNNESNYTIIEEYIIKEYSTDNENYATCTINVNDLDRKKYTYKIQNKEVNYSNIFSLLNIDFEGYVSFSPIIKHTDFTIEMPVFNSGNIVSLEDLSINTNTNFSYNFYYDKNNRILKYDMYLYSDIYYMYEKITNKEYYGYSLDTANENYTYIKYKDYINEKGIYKSEILENKILSEDESKEMLIKFEKYFEKNK